MIVLPTKKKNKKKKEKKNNGKNIFEYNIIKTWKIHLSLIFNVYKDPSMFNMVQTLMTPILFPKMFTSRDLLL